MQFLILNYNLFEKWQNQQNVRVIGWIRAFLTGFMKLAKNQRVASVNVVKEHAKEANIAKDATHTFWRIARVVSGSIEESSYSLKNSKNLKITWP